MDMPFAPFDLSLADPCCEAAARLMRDLSAEEALRYHDLGSDPFDSFQPDDVRGPRSAFVMACLDGEPVGCGALRPIDASAAEINRMYVAPGLRRRGIGRGILGELERLAVAFGYRAVRLETGNRQPEAIGLYEGFGFRRTSPFGAHANDPVSLFFEKVVAGEGSPTA